MLQRSIPAEAQGHLTIPACGRLAQSSHRLRHLAAHGTSGLDGETRDIIEALLQAAAEAEQQIADQAQRIRQLERLSITDELTGALNRRGFRRALDQALSAAARYGEGGLLLLCDLDSFKAINDTYGHLAGDTVLRAVAERVTASMRRSDHVARLGGDEFAVLLTRTAAELAARMEDKLRQIITGVAIPWGGTTLRVGASVGHQVYQGREDPDALMARADRLLYAQKRRRGRLARAAACSPARRREGHDTVTL